MTLVARTTLSTLEYNELKRCKILTTKTTRCLVRLNELTFIGFGTYSMFFIFEKLMILFFILSLISIFNIVLYSYFGGTKLKHFKSHKFMLGNLGYSSSYCKDIPFEVGKLTLE